MSSPQEDNQDRNEENPDQQGEQQQEQQQDPNALTEQDKKVYAEIMSSLNRMNKKLKSAKEKVPSQPGQEEIRGEQPQKSLDVEYDSKRATVNEIAEKLISAKENSDIVNKQDLISDVQQSFEQVVVEVYSENQQLKAKINSLVAIIKDQNKKMNEQKNKDLQLRKENEKLREELMAIKDEHLLSAKGTAQQAQHRSGDKPGIRKVITHESNHGEDYDFWSMPQNESSVKKKRDFVADSGLWVNEKDIDKSVFITDQPAGKKK